MSLLNKAAVRRFILDYAKESRAHKFTRVSPVIHEQLEGYVRDRCRHIVRSHPGVGKTIK